VSDAGRVVCELCPHMCAIADGRAGDCRVRVNLGGKLYATTYGRPSALHIDPIEKKPLYHMLPGTPIFSLATAGCNLHCAACQNWELSQRGGEEMETIYPAEPEEIVAAARERGCRSIAYTYSEPLVYYEYTLDTSTAARAAGLRNVLVTAAYANREPVRRLAQVTDAITVDVKSFDDRFYRTRCGGSLAPVLDAITTFAEAGVWVEVSNLVIPGLTDDLAQIRALAAWIVRSLGPGTPFHLLRFHPDYKLQDLPPTPPETLAAAREEALAAGLRFVYVGNLRDDEGETTRCPRDRTVLIRRAGYQILENNLRDGRCPTCGEPIPGRWT
jgi:pyruvate formate lyase activating enzyme